MLTIIYQGVVNVAEADICSFLEVAHDLNIRGISKVNLKSSISNKYNLSNVSHFNNDPSQKSKLGRVKNEKIQNNIDIQSKESRNDYVQENGGFSKYGNEKRIMLTSIENETCAKINTNEGTKQNDPIAINGKQFICETCNKEYLSSRGLHLHNETVHKGSQYFCSKCNYKATQKTHLKRHTNSIHEGDHHPCDLCDYKATIKDNLRSHKLKYHN